MRPRVGVDAGVGLLAGEHVLPDRVARRGVEEADPLALAFRLQLAQELQRVLADVCPRPLDRQRRRLGEGVDVERAQHREVVVADQRDRAALADQGGAGVGLDPVAEHVAEAPDLLGAGLLDRREHGLERRQIGVDVGNCGDPHAGQRTQSACAARTERSRWRLSIRWARRWQQPIRSPPCAAQSTPPVAPCARASRAGPSPAWSGRRRPSWATTAPTPRCCWRRPWAKTRATSPPVWPSGCAPSWARRRSSGSRSPAPASSTSSSPTTGTGGRCSASPAPVSGSGRRRPTRPSASWSSSSRPTRPVRCTSAAAATPPTATRSCACWRRPGTRSSASSTSTTPAARSSASPPRSRRG